HEQRGHGGGRATSRPRSSVRVPVICRVAHLTPLPAVRRGLAAAQADSSKATRKQRRVDVAAGTYDNRAPVLKRQATGEGGGEGDRTAGFGHDLEILEGNAHGVQHLVVACGQAGGEVATVDREGDLAGLGGDDGVADRTLDRAVGYAAAGFERARGIVETVRFGTVHGAVCERVEQGRRYARDEAASAAGAKQLVRHDAAVGEI